MRGADRSAPARLLGQPADIHLAPMGEQQRARDRRGGHHQHVGAVALCAEGQPLVDAEAMLLVDHREAEIAEFDVSSGTGHGCRRRSASNRPRGRAGCRAARPPFMPPVSSATGTGDSAESVRKCCCGQNLGRRHAARPARRPRPRAASPAAPPGFCRSRHRPAAAAASGAATARSASISASALGLRGRRRKAEAPQRLGAQMPVPGQRPARPGMARQAAQAERDLPARSSS